MRIDAHQHYWHPARGDYGWMPADDPVLSRPYGAADLAPALTAGGIDGTILVQAAPTVEETAYLLGIADAVPSVLGVVGWIDFERPDDGTLARLAQHPKFVGVRPMIQDLPDDAWMLRAAHDWAFQAIIEQDLTFDLLGFPRHLPHALTLLRRWPGLRVVLDHAMKPQIRDADPRAFADWARGMEALARETKAYCKFSALVTEADANWTIDTLQPYAQHLFAVFGPERLLWGSDWPVLRLRGEYADWLAAAEALTATLSAAARAAIFGGTARHAYRI
jgi:L-fuconolactonase